MDKVKEKAPASGGAEVSASEIIFNESITPIDGNVKREKKNFRELIVDNFAGGGGASTGIELATGRPVDIAINHDPNAILMHKTNHPCTKHYCESVWDINPAEICEGRPVGLMWLSPDCKHFSRAKGGKPVSKNIRGLAWIALRWAATVRPRVIILENVPEFVTWGRLGKDGKPDKKHMGETFRSFVYQLRQKGYKVDWRELKACDYGAPTIRKRFFLIARCDDKSIVFPKPTHGEGKELLPYRTAAECIDWSITCKSIFEREKPLAENTLRRIARGLEKFTIKADKPFIIPVGYGERCGQEPRTHDVHKPMTTVVSTVKQGVVMPSIQKYFGGIVGSDISEPLPTECTSGGHFAEIRTNIVKYGHGANLFYWEQVRELLNKFCEYHIEDDEILLLEINGENYFIADIGMRMLEPRELYNAQGFPADYIIDHDYTGKAYPRTKQIARCGNAVPPPFAEALVRANLSEMCGRKLKSMKDLWEVI